MIKSETLKELNAALSKAQKAMKNARKTSENPYYKSKYADLGEVWDACREELTSNGLAVAQLPTVRDGKVVLTYILLHESGEYLGEELEMTPVKADPQGIGSAITYARRYSLAGLAGVATEDDDGNAASRNSGEAKAVEVTTEDIPLERILPLKDDLIDEKQKAKLFERFRQELRPELRKDSDNFLRDFLGVHLYLDADGNPSANAIPKANYAAVGKAAMEFARGL
jgi:hypothetical protein